MTVEQFADARFPSRDIQSAHLRILEASMRALAFAYRREMIPVSWYMECNLTDSSKQDAVPDPDGRKTMKEGFNTVLLNRSHHCSAVREVKGRHGHEWTERPLRPT